MWIENEKTKPKQTKSFYVDSLKLLHFYKQVQLPGHQDDDIVKCSIPWWNLQGNAAHLIHDTMLTHLIQY